MDGGKGYVMDDECLFGAEVEVSKGVRINDCMRLFEHKVVTKREWEITDFCQCGRCLVFGRDPCSRLQMV